MSVYTTMQKELSWRMHETKLGISRMKKIQEMANWLTITNDRDLRELRSSVNRLDGVLTAKKHNYDVPGVGIEIKLPYSNPGPVYIRGISGSEFRDAVSQLSSGNWDRRPESLPENWGSVRKPVPGISRSRYIQHFPAQHFRAHIQDRLDIYRQFQRALEDAGYHLNIESIGIDPHYHYFRTGDSFGKVGYGIIAQTINDPESTIDPTRNHVDRMWIGPHGVTVHSYHTAEKRGLIIHALNSALQQLAKA